VIATPSSTGADDPGQGPDRQELRLLLVAANHHLASSDLRNLLQMLKSDEVGFAVNLELADPARQPELLELHRLVATPALVKLSPLPKQVFAGNAISQKLRTWLPRWQQQQVVTDLGMSLEPMEIDGSRSRRELQLEDQLLVLRQENETLAERLGVQERLLRMVAHELRTPLTAAKLAAQSHELGQIDTQRFQDVLKRRLNDIEALSQDLLEAVGGASAAAGDRHPHRPAGRVCRQPAHAPGAAQPAGERAQVHPGPRRGEPGAAAPHQPVGAGEHL
jgi:two-component system clock-associated histidine kinase SasA